MKRLLLTVLMALFAVSTFAQQDRIFTKDGREIACRITNTRDAERIFYEEYPSDDEVLHRFMPISAVDYIIRAGERLAYDDWGTLKAIKEKATVPMPVHKFIYGIGGGVTTGNFRNKQAHHRGWQLTWFRIRQVSATAQLSVMFVASNQMVLILRHLPVIPL